MHSDNELKEFIANQLPEEVHIDRSPVQMSVVGHYRFLWQDGSGEIHYSSWDYLVRRVEEKLSIQDADLYYDELYRICQNPHICPLTHTMAYVSAPWPTRTIALMKVKGETE